jgi:hypothetical protein
MLQQLREEIEVQDTDVFSARTFETLTTVERVAHS